MVFRSLLVLVVVIAAILPLAPRFSAGPAVAAPPFVGARVADASDRAYEATAIELIDHATTSIVLSMYVIQDTDDPRHPITRLLNDLAEAAQRGVDVTVYLNTKLRGVEPQAVAQAPWVARLTLAGVQVVPIASARMVHDKLLLVDARYVLEGSTNWTVAALKTNWESNTLIDSPALAQTKLFRLRAHAHHASPGQEQGQSPAGTVPVPRAVLVPRAWLARDGGLTRLVASADERAFDLYLLLWQESAQGTEGFFMDLEDLGLALGMPSTWDDTTIRRQVIKVLRKLAERDHLLEVRFFHGRDAWVRFSQPSGPTFDVPVALLEQAASPREPSAVSYLRLLRHDLAEQGIVFEELPIEDLVALTGLRPDRLKAARRALGT